MFSRTPLAIAIVSVAFLPYTAIGDAASAVRLQPIVAADPLGNRSVDQLIQPITVLDGDALEQRRQATIGETLDGLPGIANSDFGPGVGRPVIRGLQGSRVEVLEDGLRVTDVSGEGADHAVGVDTLRARQIEVIRGPATLLYGSGAAGGVVNVVTDRFSPIIPERVSGRLSSSYADNGNDRTGFASLDVPVTNNLVVRGDVSARRSSDFDINGFQLAEGRTARRGKLINSDIETDSYAFSVVATDDWGHVGFGISRWKTDYGIPGNFFPIPRDEGGFDDDLERINAELERVDFRAERRNPLPGFHTARVKASFTRFDQQEAEFEFSRATQQLEERIVEAEFEKDEFNLRVEMLHEPVGALQGVIGIEVVDTEFKADDPRGAERGFYVRPTDTRSTSIFLLEELPTDFGKLEFGARVGRETSSTDPVLGSRVTGTVDGDGNEVALQERIGQRDFTLLSFSTGALIDLGETHHLRTAITATERAPSTEQLYAFGRHAAAGTFEVGDPDLVKETYVNLELGLDRHLGNLQYDMTLFYTHVDDYIFLGNVDDGTGNPLMVDDVGDPNGGNLRNTLAFNQQADATFYGAEVKAALTVLDGANSVLPLTLRASADIVRGRLNDGGNLPRITPPRLGIGADTAWQNVEFSVDYRRVFQQNRTAEVESKTDGYNLLGADVAYYPLNVNGLRVFVAGRNLSNSDGRRHQSFFKDEAPIIGRTVRAGFTYDF